MDRRKEAGEELLTAAIYKAVYLNEQNEQEETKEGEEGIDYGVIVIPGLRSIDPEMEDYPADYIKYAQERLRAYKREQGELPKWEYVSQS